MTAKGHWLLDPSVTFLNHGSFGACPRPVLAAQAALRERLELDPVRFMLDELEPALDRVREDLSRRFSADPDGIAFVPNATTGVATVLGSIELEPGDEIVVTNHGYSACLNVATRAARARGAEVVVAEIPVPIADPDEVVTAVVRAVGPRTRLLLVDHVTSPTALVFPLEAIVECVQALGVPVLVDGAHAPGMLPLDLRRLGAAYYTANFHKWCCAPKGAAMLYVRADQRERVRPLVPSHGMTSARSDRSRFLLEFDWTGTQDPSAILSVSAALEFLEGLLPGGLAELMRRNRELALSAGKHVAEAVGSRLLAPESMLGSMVALPLAPRAGLRAHDLYRRLREHEIQIPVHAWPDESSLLVRLSAHDYNTPDDYARLARALVQVLAD